MRKIEWLYDTASDNIYIGIYGGRLYANGVVNASVALNREAYAKLSASVARARKRNSNKCVGYALI